jgi:hypothetical protein
MIGRFYAAYVDRLAADRGALAFIKWFLLGVVLQLSFMLPALPFLAIPIMREGEAGKILAVIGFLGTFLASRVFLFVLPCAAAAERKGLGSRATWGFGGFVFGPLVLGLAAALAPKTPAGERA